MRTPLTPPERSALVAACPQWSIEQHSMARTYEFADFSGAIGFVMQLALAAETLDHHPDIDIRWNRVSLTLSTHSEGTLTGLDAELARRADALAAP